MTGLSPPPPPSSPPSSPPPPEEPRFLIMSSSRLMALYMARLRTAFVDVGESSSSTTQLHPPSPSFPLPPEFPPPPVSMLAMLFFSFSIAAWMILFCTGLIDSEERKSSTSILMLPPSILSCISSMLSSVALMAFWSPSTSLSSLTVMVRYKSCAIGGNGGHGFGGIPWWHTVAGGGTHPPSGIIPSGKSAFRISSPSIRSGLSHPCLFVLR